MYESGVGDADSGCKDKSRQELKPKTLHKSHSPHHTALVQSAWEITLVLFARHCTVHTFQYTKHSSGWYLVTYCSPVNGVW